MVCIPCIVIPVLLWILHRLLLPFVYYFIPSLKPNPEPKEEKTETLDGSVENDVTNACQPSSTVKSKSE
ncbi:hypothetical protein KSF78_0009449 [Schistosoma japonicum]|nr:hypothetical protein KSF78_0009449 [Schistosoma japonicum]KAH8857183.1 hypothetical protein KSF78_0009449 [Schistosoma japonicum]KAH8857184.1 hypothetical protein KSF78_0009449 [Schistosoma japonicum]